MREVGGALGRGGGGTQGQVGGAKEEVIGGLGLAPASPRLVRV